MKRIATLLAVCLLLPFTASAADKTKTYDTKYLLEYMKQTKQDFLKSIKGLSTAQWNFKPAPDRWSVAEVAEHITLAEDFIGKNIQNNVMKAPAPTEEQKKAMAGREDQIKVLLTDRSKKFQAPEPLKPAHKFANAKEVEKAFTASRDANMQFAKSTPVTELRAHYDKSPAGEMDAYQWLIFMAGHTKRHTLQIEEVKADPKFPKK